MIRFAVARLNMAIPPGTWCMESRQRTMDHPPELSAPNRSFAHRFGPTLLQGGITPIPSALYRYQGALGLTAQEVWFISYILMYRWDDALPYPSLIRMAADTGMSRRN